MSTSLRALELISRMKSKAPTLEIKVFRSLHRVVVLTSERRNKNAVVVNGNSDHNRIISMSCLKKVIGRRNTVNHSPMSFVRVMVSALNIDPDLFFNC